MAPMTIRDNRDIWDSPYRDSVPLVPWALPLHGGTNVPIVPVVPWALPLKPELWRASPCKPEPPLWRNP